MIPNDSNFSLQKNNLKPFEPNKTQESPCENQPASMGSHRYDFGIKLA
jgi:hypothetical protein